LAYARKKLDDYREASIQAFTSEAIKDYIQKTVAGALAAKSKYNAGEADLTSKDISAKIRAKLLDQIGGGDFIIVNGKSFNVKSYAELVARTRMRESQTKATLDICSEFENDLVQIDRHDNPCEEICAEYQGNVYSISGKHPDYPELPDGGPPWHPRCLLPGTRVISPGGIIAGIRARYSGNAVEMVFSKGARLAVTENHMLLTPFGFAPAKSLREGDDVFYCPDFEGIVAGHPDEYGCPTLIEEIVGSLSKAGGMSAGRVPISPEYLHGDGRFCDGDIDVIGAYGLLGRAEQPLGPQGIHEPALRRADTLPFDFFGAGDFTAMLERLALAADGIMGGRRAPSPFFLARSGRGQDLSLRGGPCVGPVPLKNSTDGHIGRPAFPGQARGGFSGQVSADDFLVRQGTGAPPLLQAEFAHGAECDSGGAEFSPDSFRVHVNALRNLAKQHSGLIQLNKIVKVNIFPYSGHVYDLQTVPSLYICNGIVSSNCECTANPTSENALRWRNQ
jgi:hypothetical protein